MKFVREEMDAALKRALEDDCTVLRSAMDMAASKAATMRNAHIEGLCMAVVKMTGCAPTDLVLCEQIKDEKISWWIEIRKPTGGDAS